MMKGVKRFVKKQKRSQVGNSKMDRKEGPSIVIDSSDPICVSSESDSDRGMEDSIDGMPVLRTVRWRPQSIRGDDNRFVNPRQAKLLKSIRRKDTEGVKQQIKRYDGNDLTHAEDEYAVSFLEHAVRSGMTGIVDEFLSRCESEEKENAIVRALLFAIKDNDIQMVAHLIRIHRDSGFCKRHPHTTANENISIKMEPIPTKVTENDIRIPSKLELPGNQPSSGDEFPTGQNEMEMKILRPNRKNLIEQRTFSTELLLHDSEYSQDMTPIVMAAQLERTEIIRLLIDECCPEIHPLTQIPKENHNKHSCYVCQERAEFIGIQPIESCRKAIEVYKALASPAYMFQAGVEDPILEAFYISDLMEQRKVVDPAFVDEYDAISRKCKKFATDLLGLCRSCAEVTSLLQYDEGINEIHASYHSPSYPRLMVAAYYNQKEFIAHEHCQQVLQNVWYMGLPTWVCQTKCHFFRVMVYLALLTIGMPIMMILYMFRIPAVDQFIRPPVNKFLFDIITFVSFIVLLFANDLSGSFHKKGAKLSIIEGLILLWLMGYTLRFIRATLRRKGFMFSANNNYLPSWKIYQVLPLFLFWIYFGIKIILYAMKEGDYSERKTWPWYDPFLFCEAAYAIACTLNVMQLYSFFKISSNLGPLQISLKSMIFDVLSFMILFGVVLSAFAVGLSAVYTGYDGYKRNDTTDGTQVMQSNAFCSLEKSYKTLFWNIFGYGEVNDADIVVSNINVTREVYNASVFEPVGPIVKHELTEAIGYTLFGVYHICVIIVIINMLIAMMANSYNRIQHNALTEWRFGRTQLILSYMNEMGVLVPPFNLLPFRLIFGMIKKKTLPCFRARQGKKEIFQGDKDHLELIEKLSRRYWRRREALQRKDTVDRKHASIISTGSTVSSKNYSRA